ncbi:MAG: type VI secretion system tube protein TssD [Segetibacter sp.]
MAYEFYVSIEGTKQGKFKGESAREAWKGKIPALGFHYEVKSPRDTASGLATGKRQHQPVTIIKRWDGSSPQLFQALVTNELLKTVFFEFIRTNNNGEEQVYYTIKLTNASVISYEPSINQQNALSPEVYETEEVSFTFQRIEIENKLAKTVATDDWKNS